MKIEEVIQELSRYDGNLEVTVYKKPTRSKRIITNAIKTIKPMVDADTKEIVGINIAF